MAIIGITDRGLKLPYIGIVRKGAPKQEGKAPKDLDHFRVEVTEDEPGLAQLFVSKYGTSPREIDFIILFDDISKSWDAYLEAYSGDGRMIARSDNRTLLYAEFNGRKVINGKDIDTGEIVTPADLPESIKLKPVGRLDMVIPYLGRGAYLQFKTTSWTDCALISDQLEAIKATMGKIKGVPLVLKRRQGTINANYNGKRRRVKKWLVSIEIKDEVAKARIEAMMSQATQEAEYILPDEIEDDAEVLEQPEDEGPVEQQSFEQQHGRPPVEGQDFDPNGPFSEQDYAYYSGQSTENVSVPPLDELFPEDELGLVDELFPGELEEPKQEPAKLSLETVESTVNSKGIKYVALPSETLSNMSIGLGKAIAKLQGRGMYNLSEAEIGQLAQYKLKQEVIAYILKQRSSKAKSN